MNPALEVAELRELFLSSPEAWTTRLVAVTSSLILMAVVLWLVRRRRLREEFTPIWIAVALGVLSVSLFRPLLLLLTRSVGAWTASSALFFFGQLFLAALCLHYAVRLSTMVLQIKNLAQEVTLLRERVKHLEAK